MNDAPVPPPEDGSLTQPSTPTTANPAEPAINKTVVAPPEMLAELELSTQQAKKRKRLFIAVMVVCLFLAFVTSLVIMQGSSLRNDPRTQALASARRSIDIGKPLSSMTHTNCRKDIIASTTTCDYSTQNTYQGNKVKQIINKLTADGWNLNDHSAATRIDVERYEYFKKIQGENVCVSTTYNDPLDRGKTLMIIRVGCYDYISMRQAEFAQINFPVYSVKDGSLLQFKMITESSEVSSVDDGAVLSTSYTYLKNGKTFKVEQRPLKRSIMDDNICGFELEDGKVPTDNYCGELTPKGQRVYDSSFLHEDDLRHKVVDVDGTTQVLIEDEPFFVVTSKTADGSVSSPDYTDLYAFIDALTPLDVKELAKIPTDASN